MTLIAIVVALALELFFARVESWRDPHWMDRYAAWLQRLLGRWAVWDGPVGVIALLVLPLIVVGLIQSWLQGVWLGLLALIYGVVVLSYCLRYHAMDRDVEQFCDATESGAGDRAGEAMVNVMGPGRPASPSPVRDMTEALLVQAVERLFAVLFWFVLLGPLGAALYRMAWFADQRAAGEPDVDPGFAAAARRLHGILLWVPARLTAVAYALGGSFEDALHDWRNGTDFAPVDLVAGSEEVLQLSGFGALQSERHVAAGAAAGEGEAELDVSALRAAHGLVLRALVVWVTAVALITLAGWAN
jgi:membrane protein required for beta-lactamase induction